MKKIILRLDLNVPIDDKKSKIINTERIDSVMNEIKNLTKKNKVTILSHLGKGKVGDSLTPIEKYIRKSLDKNQNNNLVILENTRFWKGETEKENSKEFKETAKHFASLGDEYIDDAFAAMHRNHASIVGIPKIFKKEKKAVKIGELTKIEIKNIDKAINLAKKQRGDTLLILSGAKISTKLPLIKKFLNDGSKIFVGGGIANQIIKDVLNLDIGSSYCDKEFKLTKKDESLLLKAIKNKKIILPIDVLLKTNKVELIEKLKDKDYISDIGPASLSILKNLISNSKNIIMNGPLGVYEEGYDKSTYLILKELKKSKANILIGGGDTLSIIKKLKMKNEKNLFISTGGGAMLEYLAKDGKLPGIIALK